MVTQYFDNPVAAVDKRQYRGHMAGAFIEHGVFSFTTTGLTVEVPTYFSKILSATLTWEQAVDAPEHIYCDLEIAGGTVTVTRVARVQSYNFAIDNDNFTTNNLAATPLMVAPSALTLQSAELYEGTAATLTGGSAPNFDIGDAAFAKNYVLNEPTSESDGSTTTATIDSAAIADGDVVSIRSQAADGGTPQDWCVSLTATVAPTSGATFSYMFFGLT